MKNKLVVPIALLVFAIIAILVWLIFFYPRDYYRDRLIVYYQDDAGRNHALLIELTRFNIFPHYYQHYYSAIMFNEGETLIEQDNFQTISDEISAHGFLADFSNVNHYHLQDEGYALQLDMDGHQYQINLGQLSGDFLVNNALERLTYVNLGTTTLQMDGQPYKADFALTKTLSTDIPQSTMDGSVQGSGQYLFLTDQQGNLFLIDNTIIKAGADEYDSHHWVLYKNDTGLKKLTDANPITITEADGVMTLVISDLNNTVMTLHSLSSALYAQQTYSLLDGSGVSDSGERWLGGLRMHYEY